MTTATRLVVVGLAFTIVAITGAACGGSTSPASGAGGQADGGISSDASTDGSRPGTGGTSAATGGATGSGGSIGAGGTALGSGGATATGGAGTGGAAGAAGASGCQVSLTPAPPQSFENLEAGPNARLRVRGSVVNPGPRPAAWTWQVHFENTPSEIATMAVNDPSIVEFSIKSVGRYFILARVDTGFVCTTERMVTVKAPGLSSFVFRVTPPASSGLAIPPQEHRRAIGPAGPWTTTIDLATGTKVGVLAQNVEGLLVPSYVRVSGLLSSSVAVEGYTAGGPVNVFLLPQAQYDVLVVPDAPLAPQLFTTTSEQTGPLQIDQGTAVTGVTNDAAGVPVIGARVVLRAGLRPSTVGIADDTGRFGLWARAGTLSAVIAPPAAMGLPEVHIAADPGITLDSKGLVLTLTWAAVVRGSLSVAATSTDGAPPAVGAWVRIESEAELPAKEVGTVVVRASGAAANTGTTLFPTGVVRADLAVDAFGIARFASLPVGRYKVTAVPPASLPGTVLTTAFVTLTAAGLIAKVPLSRPVLLSGTLLPNDNSRTSGVRVIARDQSTGIVAEVTSAVVGDQGGYTLSVAPGRQYQLVADPPAGRGLARTVLGSGDPVLVGSNDTVADTFTVGGAVSFTGTVRSDGRTVGGAVVQVFCAGFPCLDPASPVAEAVTRGDGTFVVSLPSSAIAP
jgi:hypothetical protein